MTEKVFLGLNKKQCKSISVFLIALIVMINVVVLSLQEFYSENDIDPFFTQESNAYLPLNSKVAMFFGATSFQLERELNAHTGWVVNDLPTHLFAILDNTENRQLCVVKTTARAFMVMSPLLTKTKGMGKENQHILDASSQLNTSPHEWGAFGVQTDAAERKFGSALHSVNMFIKEVVNNEEDVVVFSSTALRTILDKLANADDGILYLPFSRIIEAEDSDDWSTVDDRFYCAQGGARVARDMLVALRSLFPSMIDSGGGAVFLDNAILAFDRVAKWNPWLVMETTHDLAEVHHQYAVAFRNLAKLSATIKN